MLCEAHQARELPFDDWFGKLAGLPDHLIYERPREEVSSGVAHKMFAEPEQVATAQLWGSAIEQAATGDLPVLCPVNRDAYLAIDGESADGETATGKSIEDLFFFVNQGKIRPEQPFPFGRHRFWCPGCGAERYLVVTRRPD
jgi:hypothetical protein